MKRLATVLLLTLLTIASVIPVGAKTTTKPMTPEQNARYSRKQAKHQQRMLNHANKKQRKATKKFEKRQRKETRQANKNLQKRRSS